jgi:hypothetical protein
MGIFTRRRRPEAADPVQRECEACGAAPGDDCADDCIGQAADADTRDAVYWFTQESEPFVAAAGDMDDDGCLSDAYGVLFYLAPAATSALTIWAYAAPCGPEPGDGYFVGFCISYQALRGGTSWEAKLYHGEEYPEWYATVGEAAEAARKTVVDLLNNQAAAAPVHATADVIADWFDWDGEPF